MRERYSIKNPDLLAAIKSSKKKEVRNIMMLLEAHDSSDEIGKIVLHMNVLYRLRHLL
jgi:hypothetical protein